MFRIGPSRVPFSRIFLLAALAHGTACSEQVDEAVRTLRFYELLVAYPRATASATSAGYLSVRRATIGGFERDALFMHPVSSVEFPPVLLTELSSFTAFLGIADSVHKTPGDGVEFSVRLKLGDDTEVRVFSRYIDGRTNLAERGWVPIRVPLGSFAGQYVRIILATSPGADSDNNFDWSYWGEPRVILDEKR